MDCPKIPRKIPQKLTCALKAVGRYSFSQQHCMNSVRRSSDLKTEVTETHEAHSPKAGLQWTQEAARRHHGERNTGLSSNLVGEFVQGAPAPYANVYICIYIYTYVHMYLCILYVYCMYTTCMHVCTYIRVRVCVICVSIYI